MLKHCGEFRIPGEALGEIPVAAGRTQEQRGREDPGTLQISRRNGALHIQHAVTLAGDAAHMAHRGEASLQRFLGAARNRQRFGFFRGRIDLLTNRVPVEEVHVHMRVDQARCHLVCAQINLLGALRGWD